MTNDVKIYTAVMTVSSTSGLQETEQRQAQNRPKQSLKQDTRIHLNCSQPYTTFPEFQLTPALLTTFCLETDYRFSTSVYFTADTSPAAHISAVQLMISLSSNWCQPHLSYPRPASVLLMFLHTPNFSKCQHLGSQVLKNFRAETHLS